MTEQELASLERLHAAASREPWEARMHPNVGPGYEWYDVVRQGGNVQIVRAMSQDPADVNLIAAAVNALPALLMAAREANRLAAEADESWNRAIDMQHEATRARFERDEANAGAAAMREAALQLTERVRQMLPGVPREQPVSMGLGRQIQNACESVEALASNAGTALLAELEGLRAQSKLHADDWARLMEHIALHVGDAEEHDAAHTDHAFVEQFDPWTCLKDAGAELEGLRQERDYVKSPCDPTCDELARRLQCDTEREVESLRTRVREIGSHWRYFCAHPSIDFSKSHIMWNSDKTPPWCPIPSPAARLAAADALADALEGFVDALLILGGAAPVGAQAQAQAQAALDLARFRLAAYRMASKEPTT